MAADTLTFDNTLAVLNEYGAAVRNAYQDAIVREGSNASGNLMNAAEFLIEQDGGTFRVSLALAKYWKYVEHGRKPGKFPPPSAIMEWIKIKPVLPKPDASGKLPTQKSLAFLIGRKIAREGIKAKPLLAGAVEGQTSIWMDRIAEALATDLQRAIVPVFDVGKVGP